jgi:hypothetical protein
LIDTGYCHTGIVRTPYSTEVNQQAGQYRNHLLKSRYFRVGWVQKSGNIFWKTQPILKNLFTSRLSDNGPAIVPQEVCWNQKFVADVCMLFFAKTQILNFVSIAKGSQNPQDRFRVGLIVKLVVKFGISCVGIFLLAGTV